MKLSLRKYLGITLKWLALFAVIEVLLLVGWLTGVLETGIFLMITVAINGVFTLLPAGYYFIMYLNFKNKCERYTPVEGVVSNWEAGFFQHTGSVMVKVDGNEYRSSAYFSSDEAKDLVGNSVLYAIIDEQLFIYEIKA